MMRAVAVLVVVTIGSTACGPGKGVDPSQYAKLPPQDTLAGGLAPAPSTATGGSAATPAHPSQPATVGNALTSASTPPTPAAARTETGPAGTSR